MNSALFALALLPVLQAPTAPAPSPRFEYRAAPQAYSLGGNNSLRGFTFNGAGPFWSTQQAPGEQRGWLGVALEDDGDGGVAITAVVPSSPAARAQLRSGDRLLSIGGTQVDSYDALVEVLKSHRPDDDVAVVLEREITVHLDDAHKDGERYVLGVYLAEAKDKSSKKPGGDEQRGALVTRLNETYPAGRAGIEGGDRLLSIDGQPVDDSDSVIAALAGVHEERDVSVRIERTRQVKLGARPDAAPSRLGTPSPLAAPSPFGTPRATTPSTPTPTAPSQPRARTVRPATPPAPQAPPDGLEEELRALSQELRELREQVSRLRSQIDRLKER